LSAAPQADGSRTTRPRILLERNKRAAHALKGRGQV
jgi:hypothetical protein